MFIFMQKINFIPSFFLEILQIYHKLDIWVILAYMTMINKNYTISL